MSDASEKLLVGLQALTEHLNNNGYPTKYSTIAKMCAPRINTGPRKLGRWGKQDIFSPSESLEWARSRAGINEHAA
jgi:hypothetical protein